MTRLRALTTALLLALTSPAIVLAQPAKAPAKAAEPFTPFSGQPGKDVVWVPTQQALVDRMLDMARVTPGDYLVDLGSGDGRTVISAARRGVRAHGIEYNPQMVELSKRNAREAGVQKLATFERGDIFEKDFSRATVVTLFLLPGLNERLRPTLLKMRPGTRVVSNTFAMGDWDPDQTYDAAAGCTSFCRAHLWIIPARVDGRWRLGDGTLSFEQRYQKVQGTLERGGKQEPVTDAMLRGSFLMFTVDGKRYMGSVNGRQISGQVDGQPWSASKL